MLLLAVALPLSAQDKQHHRNNRRDVAEVVSDLSQGQKKKLDAITNASRQRVDALRMQQKAVRDSIGMYIKMDGDQSKALFPLFDREAKISRDIAREMYTAKVRIEEILTPAQRQQLREANCRHTDKPKKKSHKR